MESSDPSSFVFSSPSTDQSSVESSDIASLLNDSLEVETEPTPEDEDLPCTLWNLRESFASNDWIDVSNSSFSKFRLCKISTSPTGSLQPPAITHYLVVNSDLTWSLSIHNHLLNISNCTEIKNIPHYLCPKTLNSLVRQVNCLNICCGQSDPHFVSMFNAKKGKVLSSDGSTTAFVDRHIQPTIRTASCHLLTASKICSPCKAYRNTLRAMYSRWTKRSNDLSDTSSHTNERYLSTPEKVKKMKNLKTRVRTTEKANDRLKARINQLTLVQGEKVDPALQEDLLSVMSENNVKIRSMYPENSFARVFWEQQLQAASVKDNRQVRWHPLMIKWCVNLKLISGAAYHALRTSGFVTLPSERTLRDYTHYFSSDPGYQPDLNLQLQKEANIEALPEHCRYVSLLVDEMKIKEDLVYNKYSGHIIGFTHLGDMNDLLLKMEAECNTENTSCHPPLSKHILVLMVRGIFFKLEFSYAHFATRTVTADMLYPIIWDGIRQLESIGFKVICVTADGASPNRKFFRMHGSKNGDYKTHNPFANPKEKRMLYFISDPPHLLKTTRNCLSHSDGSTGTRWMMVNGKHIEWNHIKDLYLKTRSMAETSSGLSLLPKLKKEHVELTSFSRMRVDLAAQVLSKSVADALAYFGDPSTSETEVFIRYFDKWFDCMNVRSLSEAKTKRKADLEPYTSPDDCRLKWLKDDFLAYLDRWKASVKTESSTPESERKMQISEETLEGLHITVNSFVEMARYLLRNRENSLFLLSERLSQDPLENYFGRQRGRGGRNENPNLQQCLNSAASLRIQRSVLLDPIRGNCRRKRQLDIDEKAVIDSKPLPKRKRRKNQS